MPRTLVIGGTLFIGRALVEKLLARGDDVTILHRGKRNPFEGRTGELICDRNDGRAMAALLREHDFDVVFDNVYDWQHGTPPEAVEAAACACGKNLRRYVFMSSVAAYGSGLDHDEDDSLAPSDDPDLYCRNKASTERMLFALHHKTGFPAVTLRPPYIYGPGNPFYREQFFFDRLDAGRPIIVPGDGSRLMQFVLVDDLVDAALAAAERPEAAGRAYNIAHESPVTQGELVDALAEAAGTQAEKVFVPRDKLLAAGGQVFDPPFYFAQYYDMDPITQKIDRARRELGFEPTSFAEGLRRTYEAYRAAPRPEPDFSFDVKILGR